MVGRTSIPEMVRMFRLRFPAHAGGIELYPDATGQNLNVQTGLSSHDTVIAAFRGYPSQITLQAAQTNPRVRDRVNSMNSILNGAGEWMPLEVDETAEMTIRDFAFVEWDEKGTDLMKITKIEDERSTLTHATDALGYWGSLDAPLATIYLPEKENGNDVPNSLNPFNAQMGPRELIQRLKERQGFEDDNWSDWI